MSAKQKYWLIERLVLETYQAVGDTKEEALANIEDPSSVQVLHEKIGEYENPPKT